MAVQESASFYPTAAIPIQKEHGILSSSNDNEKGIFAKGPIPAGRVVWKEGSIWSTVVSLNGDKSEMEGKDTAEEYGCVASVVNQDSLSSLCSSCFSGSSRPSRCSRCGITHYCSVNCQKKDWQQGHRIECQGFNALQKNPKVSGKRPPTFFRLLFRILLQLINHPNTSAKGNSSVMTLNHKYVTFLQLKDHQSTSSEEEKIELSQIAASLHAVLCQLFPDNNVDLSFNDLLSIVYKTHCNAISITDSECQVVGVGLYLRTARLNHSCAPNCVASFEGSGCDIRIRSIRSINAALNQRPFGEELTIAYIDIGQPRNVRQKELWTRYRFNCRCSRCEMEKNKAGENTSVYSRIQELGGSQRELIAKQQWAKSLEVACKLLESQRLVYPDYYPILSVTAYTIAKLTAVVCADEADVRISDAAQIASQLSRISHGEESDFYLDSKRIQSESEAARLYRSELESE